MNTHDAKREKNSLQTLELGPHATLRLASFKPHSDNELVAELRIHAPGGRNDDQWQDRYAGIEDYVYAEIEGLGRAQSKTIDLVTAPKADAIICHLRFSLGDDHITAILAGAEFGFGVDDDRMRVGARVKRALLDTLLSRL